jgi:small subunit ribosomal protein S16
MTKLGRRHRPFFRLCAVDGRATRDGKVIEYLGHYDPMIKETDARAQLNNERIDYWISVGAQPSDKVAVLIKKYGSKGTHLTEQQAALQRLALSKPTAPPPMVIPRKQDEAPAAEAAEGAAGEETATAEAPAAEAPAAEAPAAEAPAAEAPAAEAPAAKTAEPTSEASADTESKAETKEEPKE